MLRKKGGLYFDNMLTPKLITFVYWLLLFVSIAFGLSSMFGGFGGFSMTKMVMGLVYALGGALGARIWCELLIVLFKMNEALQELRRK